MGAPTNSDQSSAIGFGGLMGASPQGAEWNRTASLGNLPPSMPDERIGEAKALPHSITPWRDSAGDGVCAAMAPGVTPAPGRRGTRGGSGPGREK